MFYSHVFGSFVRRMREMRIAGSSPADIVELIRRHSGDDDRMQYDYLRSAFRRRDNQFFYSVPPYGHLDPDREQRAARLMDEFRSEWERERFPELMRLRDYFAFLQFARDQQLIVTVCDANRFAGRYIGQAGFRCYSQDLFVTSRETAPNEGLVAADPSDERLQSALRSYDTALSYQEYIERLRRQGMAVAAPSEGYVLEDTDGNRFHEGYRLHGVYDAETHEPAWTARRGLRLQAAINRLLGAELVHLGPHDDWEHRNDRAIAGPLFGPLLPLIRFNAEGFIHNYTELADFKEHWESEGRWGTLYPHHPFPEAGS